LLFIIYINDIVGVCPNECTIKLFADDTLIYVVAESSSLVDSKLNVSLQKLEKWMELNKLKLNVNKTKCMLLKN
jgi:hypothetical protein